MSTNINNAFRVEGGLSLDDVVGIFQGSVDPSAGVGQPAPAGSLFLRTNGTIYSKIGASDTQWGPMAAGGGTVTSVSLSPPAAGGITVSGSPITTSGTFQMGLADDLAAVEALTTTGLPVRTGLSTWTTRTLTASLPIVITNGDGISGNPTISLTNNPILPGTASVTIPVGTTAQRAATPTTGMIRYNSTLGLYEGYQSTGWVQFASSQQSSVIRRLSVDINGATGTTRINVSATPPLITDGTEIASITITPSSTTSVIKLELDGYVASSSSNKPVTVALFRDSVFLNATVNGCGSSNDSIYIGCKHVETPGVTTPVVYSARIGVGAGGTTWYINRTSSVAVVYGGTTSLFELTEFTS